MFPKQTPSTGIALLMAGILLGGLAIYFYQDLIWRYGRMSLDLLADRKKLEAFIASFGWAAPLVFMGIQILQVILAPIPGEATGFIGGFLFGSLAGFVYSSLALSIGSWINFAIGRTLGEYYVRRMVSPKRFAKFDRMLRRQGVLIIFFLFVFPGFPKDWLCLFLGITTLPTKPFLLLAAFGRMPGTLLLSLQGDLLFAKNYALFASLIGVTLAISGGAFLWRERIYAWLEKNNHI